MKKTSFKVIEFAPSCDQHVVSLFQASKAKGVSQSFVLGDELGTRITESCVMLAHTVSQYRKDRCLAFMGADCPYLVYGGPWLVFLPPGSIFQRTYGQPALLSTFDMSGLRRTPPALREEVECCGFRGHLLDFCITQRTFFPLIGVHSGPPKLSKFVPLCDTVPSFDPYSQRGGLFFPPLTPSDLWGFSDLISFGVSFVNGFSVLARQKKKAVYFYNLRQFEKKVKEDLMRKERNRRKCELREQQKKLGRSQPPKKIRLPVNRAPELILMKPPPIIERLVDKAVTLSGESAHQGKQLAEQALAISRLEQVVADLSKLLGEVLYRLEFPSLPKRSTPLKRSSGTEDDILSRPLDKEMSGDSVLQAPDAGMGPLASVEFRPLPFVQDDRHQEGDYNGSGSRHADTWDWIPGVRRCRPVLIRDLRVLFPTLTYTVTVPLPFSVTVTGSPTPLRFVHGWVINLSDGVFLTPTGATDLRKSQYDNPLRPFVLSRVLFFKTTTGPSFSLEIGLKLWRIVQIRPYCILVAAWQFYFSSIPTLQAARDYNAVVPFSTGMAVLKPYLFKTMVHFVGPLNPKQLRAYLCLIIPNAIRVGFKTAKSVAPLSFTKASIHVRATGICPTYCPLCVEYTGYWTAEVRTPIIMSLVLSPFCDSAVDPYYRDYSYHDPHYSSLAYTDIKVPSNLVPLLDETPGVRDPKTRAFVSSQTRRKVFEFNNSQGVQLHRLAPLDEQCILNPPVPNCQGDIEFLNTPALLSFSADADYTGVCTRHGETIIFRKESFRVVRINRDIPVPDSWFHFYRYYANLDSRHNATIFSSSSTCPLPSRFHNRFRVLACTRLFLNTLCGYKKTAAGFTSFISPEHQPFMHHLLSYCTFEGVCVPCEYALYILFTHYGLDDDVSLEYSISVREIEYKPQKKVEKMQVPEDDDEYDMGLDLF